MNFDPKAIKDACVAGEAARAAGLLEEPPKGYSQRQKAAWRMGYAGTASITDPLLIIDNIEDQYNPGTAAPTWDWRHPVDCQLRQWGDRYRKEGGLAAPPPARAPELAAFVAEHRADLERLAAHRGRYGGYPASAIRARTVLGLTKRKSSRGVSRNDPAEDARLRAGGWTPVKGKPGHAWREFWTADGRPGRVNVFATADDWKVRLSMTGGAFEYWPECFPTAEAARTAAHARLNLQRPQLEKDSDMSEWSQLLEELCVDAKGVRIAEFGNRERPRIYSALMINRSGGHELSAPTLPQLIALIEADIPENPGDEEVNRATLGNAIAGRLRMCGDGIALVVFPWSTI